MYYYSTYWLFALPALIFVLIAQMMVNNSYRKYSEIKARSNMTGADVAREILSSNNIRNVDVQLQKGTLTDHYDPSKKVVKLSEGVYNGTSIAALAVAAHECGHVLQDDKNYSFFRFRMAIIPVCSIGSNLAIPIFLIGLLLGSLTGEVFMNIGILLFGAAVVFQVITLPVEFNASSRALAVLEDRNFLSSDEIPGAKTMLNAAALTYVAALASSVSQLLHLLFLRGNRRR